MKITLDNTEDGLLLVETTENYNLKNFPKEYILGMLKHNGVLLFRKFDTNPVIFSDFIAQSSKRVTIDPARNNTEKNTQLVDAGFDAVGLHTENGTTPFSCHIVSGFIAKKLQKMVLKQLTVMV